MSSFVNALADPVFGTLKAEVLATIRARFPDFEFSEGDPDDLLTNAFTRLAVIAIEQGTTLPRAAFGAFGEKIVNVPRIAAAPALVTSTWTLADDAGHTIPAGTQVTIAANAEESAGFVVVADVVVAAGASETAEGEVQLRAIEPGAAGNGLPGPVVLVDSLAFVESVAMVGVAAGGVDEEDEDAYLDRLTEDLQLLSLSLIVPRDFEIDARAHAGVSFALCVPGYDLSTKTADTPLTLTVFVKGADGGLVPAPEKEALRTSQQARVPSGVEVFVGDAKYTVIDVEESHTVLPGYEPAAIDAAVEAAIADYLSPARSGVPTTGDPGSSGGWESVGAVYRNELISLCDRVPGVGRVVSLKLAKHGAKLESQESVALEGVAPATEAGTVTAAAV